MSLQDIDRDILDEDLRIWILSNDQRVQRKSKIDSVRSFFEAQLERVLNVTENKWKLCVDKFILNNEQDNRLYVKLKIPMVDLKEASIYQEGTIPIRSRLFKRWTLS